MVRDFIKAEKLSFKVSNGSREVAFIKSYKSQGKSTTLWNAMMRQQVTGGGTMSRDSELRHGIAGGRSEEAKRNG